MRPNRWIALAACMLALAGCAGTQKVAPRVVQAEVPKARAVAPVAGKVRDNAHAVEVSAAKVEVTAANVSREAKDLRRIVGSLTTEAERLRKVEAMTAQEKADLWAKLTEVSRSSALLESYVEEQNKALSVHHEQRRQLTVAIAELEGAVREKDTEVAGLRLQLKDEEESAKTQAEFARTESQRADREAAKAATSKGTAKALGWGLVAVSLLLAGACVVIYLRR